LVFVLVCLHSDRLHFCFFFFFFSCYSDHRDLHSFPTRRSSDLLEKELIEHAQVKVGDSIRVAIDRYPTKEEFATGHIVQSMADRADTEIIIPQTILEYGLPYEFPVEVIHEAESFKEPTAKDREGRVDLRDLALVTVDGEDGRDFDDAVYAEKQPG